MQQRLITFLAMAAFGLFSHAAAAQSFPTKPITLVVGYSAGGSVDLAARTIAPELSKRLGQTVIVENVAGAGGALGAQKVVSAPADGYTLLLGTSAEIAVGKLVSPNVRYDGLSDLHAVGLLGTQPMMLVAGPAVAYSDLANLIEAIRKSPGTFSYGSAGNASLPHLAGELFKTRTQTDIVHVPYKGAAPMMSDLLGNQIQLGMLVFSSALPQVKAGKLRAIAVTEPTRSEQMPNVPALAETKTLAGFDLSVFFGVFARAGTPPQITARIAEAMVEAMKQPDVRAKLTEAGFTVRALDSSSSTKFIAQQAKTYREIVEQSKIRE
jgi:tripartite-type tricarboxylate transporter receptor subunit TctC